MGTQQTRDIDSMLILCQPIVCEFGRTLSPHWIHYTLILPRHTFESALGQCIILFSNHLFKFIFKTYFGMQKRILYTAVSLRMTAQWHLYNDAVNVSVNVTSLAVFSHTNLIFARFVYGENII